MFDPHSCDSSGLTTSNGTSVILHFATLKNMVYYLRCKYNTYIADLYNLTLVTCQPSESQIEIYFQEQKYFSIRSGKQSCEIKKGSGKQSCEIKKGNGKQSCEIKKGSGKQSCEIKKGSGKQSCEIKKGSGKQSCEIKKGKGTGRQTHNEDRHRKDKKIFQHVQLTHLSHRNEKIPAVEKDFVQHHLNMEHTHFKDINGEKKNVEVQVKVGVQNVNNYVNYNRTVEWFVVVKRKQT